MKGTIRQRNKGSWTLIYDMGRDRNGKRKQKWHSVHGTKRHAQQELNRLIHELNTGVYAEPSQMSVAGYLKPLLSKLAF